MPSQEWSRSRYWLCHFLNSRHERARIAWSEPLKRAGVGDGVLTSLAALPSTSPADLEAMACRVAVRNTDDPAMVQAVRLMTKERAHHADVMSCVQRRWALTPGPASRPRRAVAFLAARLGARFELSVLLLSDLLDTALLRRLDATLEDHATRQAIQLITRERRAHAMFFTERLTMELADLNFVRRNLRRVRLRAMFVIALTCFIASHHKALRESRIKPTAFALDAWQGFRSVLERMVPYHRDALLSALLAQRDRPYDKSADAGI